jgi:hypothetical protein
MATDSSVSPMATTSVPSSFSKKRSPEPTSTHAIPSIAIFKLFLSILAEESKFAQAFRQKRACSGVFVQFWMFFVDALWEAIQFHVHDWVHKKRNGIT